MNASRYLTATLWSWSIAVFLSPAILAQQATDNVAPEAASGTHIEGFFERSAASLAAKTAGQPVAAENWMIVAANPLAVEAGAEVLAVGGSAADAMIATQAVLGLVEPQSSGLGGGAFLVWYNAESGELTTLDGRETAPAAATPSLFQTEDGEPMGFFDAVIGGRSVGTPGIPALMEDAHRRWGRASWTTLFDRAIQLSENGFEASPRLVEMIVYSEETLSVHPPVAEMFLTEGTALEIGEITRNPAYAETLRTIAKEGADAFYTGSIAAEIVQTVQDFAANPGLLDLDDLAAYQVKERPAVCAGYRDYEICGMGPPSSGALSVGQILGLLEPFDIGAMGPDSPEAWRLIGDASRLAFADRGLYMADSDFVAVPTKGLVDPAYLAERAQLLEGATALTEVSPGEPGFDHAMLWAPDESLELPSTTHISIVDSYGNALSMTSSIENGFGSRLMAPGGFLLNNQLTDFSFRSHDNGRPIANALAPGKRPRSSMAPTIVLRDGAPVMVIGSPGGSRIIGYVAQAIINTLDWGMDIQQALDMPHRVNRFGPFDLEAGTSAEAMAPALEALGYEVSIRPLTSGTHGIVITEEGLLGGADPRREGIAIGE
ncbi:MAG: gamma-glutamyltransferase [Pseudomonadota bacterium]